MSQFTQGDWVQEFNGDISVYRNGQYAFTVCESPYDGPGNDGRANGRLIASAPALLERLQAAVTRLEQAAIRLSISSNPTHQELAGYMLDEAALSRAVIGKALNTVIVPTEEPYSFAVACGCGESIGDEGL